MNRRNFIRFLGASTAMAAADIPIGRAAGAAGTEAARGSITMTLQGWRAAGQPMQLTIPATLTAAATHTGLPSVWARTKIAALADQSTYAPNATLATQIKQIALDYSLMSAFTAFVAVDSTRRTEGAEGTTVPVAVPVPEGVKYETTVDEK